MRTSHVLSFALRLRLASPALLLTALGLVLTAGSLGAQRTAHASAAKDSAAALALFRENIDAIHKRDHPRYLRTYLQTAGLTLGGLRGMSRGWMDWPARTDSTPSWPDTLIVSEMRVAPMVPGVVYGMYRYRGIVQGKAAIGISERVFVKTPHGWKISYTASFPDSLAP